MRQAITKLSCLPGCIWMAILSASYTCPVFSRPVQSTYHHVPGDFNPTGTFIMRVAKRKVLAVSSNIFPWPKPGLCTTEARMWEKPMIFAASRHVGTPSHAASGQMFATMVVLQLPPSESWPTGNWHGITQHTHLSYRNLIKLDAKQTKTNQRGLQNKQIYDIR